MEYGSSSSELIGKPSSPLPSPSSSAVIYAELLPNIRQVSIFVSLQTPPSPDTRAEFSSDGLSFTIVHDGRVSTLRLPGKVAEFSSLHLLPTSRKELSFRLPLDQATSQATDVGSGNFVPWTASSLAATTSASCRECGVTLMEAQTVKIWKDLPSENWAEMMEFWHCHKPGEHGHPTEINHVGKGYTASEKIMARTGLGLVDLCYFLLSEQDCSGVKV
jgi:ubiquitin-protein ligase E3 D